MSIPYEKLIRKCRNNIDNETKNYGKLLSYLKFRMSGRKIREVVTETKFFDNTYGNIQSVKQYVNDYKTDFKNFDKNAGVINIEKEKYIFG